MKREDALKALMEAGRARVLAQDTGQEPVLNAIARLRHLLKEGLNDYSVPSESGAHDRDSDLTLVLDSLEVDPKLDEATRHAALTAAFKLDKVTHKLTLPTYAELGSNYLLLDATVAEDLRTLVDYAKLMASP